LLKCRESRTTYTLSDGLSTRTVAPRATYSESPRATKATNDLKQRQRTQPGGKMASPSTGNTAATVPPLQRNINVHIPAELLEMILLAAGEDWHFVFSMVCRRWRDVLSSWRSRGKRCSKLRTPRAVGLHTFHLAVWSRDNGLPMTAFTYTAWYKVAAENGRLEVLQWLRAMESPWDLGTCAYAAHHGHLDVLQWVRANNCPWGEGTCAYAAENGHLAVLQWARANGCPWDENTCGFAAMNGHLAVLQWSRANGCPWDTATCAFAALNGHLAILQWARTNGCPWDTSTCAYAAMRGSLEVLKWARVNGCPWDEDTCDFAAAGGHLAVLQWARANGCPES
jgi:hypothetical protein